MKPHNYRLDVSTVDIATRYLAGETTKQIAGSLGMGVTSVRSRLHEARVPLRAPARHSDAGYSAFHLRVSKERGRPAHCEHCGTTDPGKHYDWASLTKNYADVFDYVRLCRLCHQKMDDVSAKKSAARRGRSIGQVGSKNPGARLTEANVVDIRTLSRAGNSQLAIALKFGVSRKTIGFVLGGHTWKHVANV